MFVLRGAVWAVWCMVLYGCMLIQRCMVLCGVVWLYGARREHEGGRRDISVQRLFLTPFAPGLVLRTQPVLFRRPWFTQRSRRHLNIRVACGALRFRLPSLCEPVCVRCCFLGCCCCCWRRQPHSAVCRPLGSAMSDARYGEEEEGEEEWESEDSWESDLDSEAEIAELMQMDLVDDSANTGKQEYLAACSELNIVPVAMFIAKLECEHINLRHHGASPPLPPKMRWHPTRRSSISTSSTPPAASSSSTASATKSCISSTSTTTSTAPPPLLGSCPSAAGGRPHLAPCAPCTRSCPALLACLQAWASRAPRRWPQLCSAAGPQKKRPTLRLAPHPTAAASPPPRPPPQALFAPPPSPRHPQRPPPLSPLPLYLLPCSGPSPPGAFAPPGRCGHTATQPRRPFRCLSSWYARRRANAKIRSLNLGDNWFGDEGVQAVAEVRPAPTSSPRAAVVCAALAAARRPAPPSPLSVGVDDQLDDHLVEPLGQPHRAAGRQGAEPPPPGKRRASRRNTPPALLDDAAPSAAAAASARARLPGRRPRPSPRRPPWAI